MSKGTSSLSIIGALAANVAVAITKFIAAAFTGSSSMISEGIHSVVDSLNMLVLLFGHKKSRKPADDAHPFGYGMEMYFWTLVVAMSLFGIGGGMSIYEGITHLQHPEPLENPVWNYVILGLSILFNGISWIIAFREFSKTNKGRGLWKSVKNSKDPSTFAILFEDTADIAGLIIAFVGIYLSQYYGDSRIDGIASILIGLILTLTSVMLARESKGLLLGESASATLLDEVVQIAKQDQTVVHVKRPATMHMGPEDIVLAMSINFVPEINSQEVAEAIDRIEMSIRNVHPEIQRIFIEAKSLQYFSDKKIEVEIR